MSRASRWTRGEPLPQGVQVAASVTLGVVLVAAGALRAAADVPMSIALATMGVALLVQAVQAVQSVQGARRREEGTPDVLRGQPARLATADGNGTRAVRPSQGSTARPQRSPVTIHAVPRARRPVVSARAAMKTTANATHSHASPAAPGGAHACTASAAGA